MKKPWHDDPKFWKLTAPFMFDETRWKRTPKQVAGFIKRLGMKKGMKVLDLCCGPGRVSLELARRGFDVVGVDHTSPLQRERTRFNAAQGGIPFGAYRNGQQAADGYRSEINGFLNTRFSLSIC